MKYTSEQLLALSKSEKDSRKRLRLLALSHFIDGKSRTYIAEILKVSRTSVNLWVSNYLSAGLEGLESKKAKGRISYLTERQKQKLCSYIEEHSEDKHKGGRLTGESILTYIKHMNGRIYDPTLGRFLQADPHIQAPMNSQNYVNVR